MMEYAMQIESARFGNLEVDPAKVIQFPAGLPGFEDCKGFTVIELERRDGPALAVLQSVEHGDVAFSVTVPDEVGLHYEFTLDEDELEVLGARDPKDIAVLIILRREDSNADAGIKANLMAPLVINANTRVGIQKVIGQVGCDITLRAKD
jgi:flagellar assembly factor FliW